MNVLPINVNIKIFSYLNLREKCYFQRVSQLWRELLQDFSLWKTIDTNFDKYLTSDINDDILAIWLARFGNHVETVRLRYCRKLTNHTCFLIAEHCRGILCVDFQGCLGVTDVGVSEISACCERLQKINLFMTGVTDSSCEEIVRGLPNLTSFKLPSRGNCYKILENLTNHRQIFHELIVNDGIPLDQNDLVVNDYLIKKVAKAFPMLVKLSLNWCWYITDESLLIVASNCRNLRHLGITECYQVSNEGVRKFIDLCPELRKLKLGRLYSVSDSLAKSFEGTKHGLRSIEMIDTSITDKGVSRILENTLEMRRVYIGEYCFNSTRITGDLIFSCTKYCKNLVKLIVVSSKSVNDSMIQAIGENLPRLRILLLSCCKDVTEEALISLSQDCKQIEELRICKCEGMTEDVLNRMIDSLSLLKSLELYGCNRISFETVMNAMKKRPKVIIRI